MIVKVFIYGIPATLSDLLGEYSAGRLTCRVYRDGAGCALHCTDRDDPAVSRTAKMIGYLDAAIWLAEHGLTPPKEMWPDLRGRYEFNANGEPIIPPLPATTKRIRKRHRQSATKIYELTPEQAEAMHLIGEHKGNVTTAAKAAGKTRQAMQKLYGKALIKLGKAAVKKPQTKPLRTDQRGQDDVTGSDDRRK